MSDLDQMSIGEVINLLREDFPDVSVSKLRFLESQGLIDPDRTSSGYRQFRRGDLRRIRFILQQQRDHFLPLKVIKSKLTMWERGEALDDEDDSALSSLADGGEPLTRADLLRISSLTDAQLDDLQSHGILKPLDGSTVFGPEARVIAVEARRLMENGLEARHLRAVRLGVDRESEILRQLTAPLLRATNAEAQAQARDTLASCAESIQALHKAMLVADLRALTT